MHVDQNLCQGHGRCYTVAPEVFEPDEIGNGIELHGGEVAPEHERAAMRAVANCPERAIEVVDAPVSIEAGP